MGSVRHPSPRTSVFGMPSDSSEGRSPKTARTFVALGALCALGAIAITSCGAKERARRDGDPPNIVIFLIDTLRADRLGAYGYERDTSPEFDALVSSSVLFTEANAAAPWTLPSVVSLMVSSFLSEHGVARDRDVVDPTTPTLATRAQELGFTTASYYENPYAGPLSGLDRGFDLCLQVEKNRPGAEELSDWLDIAPDDPFFVYLHNALPHDPYFPEREHLERFGSVSDEEAARIWQIQKDYRALTRGNRPGQRNGREDTSPLQTKHMDELASRVDAINALYDGEVRQIDQIIGEVVDVLKARGAWNDTIFVVVSDHGEEMGEHGGWEHDHSVYEELVRIPLLIHFPNDEFAGTRVDSPVSLIDVMPTLLDYLGATEFVEQCSGSSVLDAIRAGQQASGTPRVTAYRFNLKKFYAPFDAVRGDENIVVRDGTWKGIWNVGRDTFELYDLAADRDETHDVASDHPERVAELRAVAEARRARDAKLREGRTVPQREPLTADERAKLEGLGYIGGSE